MTPSSPAHNPSQTWMTTASFSQAPAKVCPAIQILGANGLLPLCLLPFHFSIFFIEWVDYIISHHPPPPPTPFLSFPLTVLSPIYPAAIHMLLREGDHAESLRDLQVMLAVQHNHENPLELEVPIIAETGPSFPMLSVMSARLKKKSVSDPFCDARGSPLDAEHFMRY